MRSWLTGFLAFGLAYTAFVTAIYVNDWPTFANPHLYGTLEAKLSDSNRESVLKASKSASLVNHASDALYVLVNDGKQDGSFISSIVLTNRHTLWLKPKTTPGTAENIAGEYVGLVNAHVKKTSQKHEAQMYTVLLIPLILLTLFAFFARWLWNKISKLD